MKEITENIDINRQENKRVKAVEKNASINNSKNYKDSKKEFIEHLKYETKKIMEQEKNEPTLNEEKEKNNDIKTAYQVLYNLKAKLRMKLYNDVEEKRKAKEEK